MTNGCTRTTYTSTLQLVRPEVPRGTEPALAELPPVGNRPGLFEKSEMAAKGHRKRLVLLFSLLPFGILAGDGTFDQPQ